jgi:hypothetical protein
MDASLKQSERKRSLCIQTSLIFSSFVLVFELFFRSLFLWGCFLQGSFHACTPCLHPEIEGSFQNGFTKRKFIVYNKRKDPFLIHCTEAGGSSVIGYRTAKIIVPLWLIVQTHDDPSQTDCTEIWRSVFDWLYRNGVGHWFYCCQWSMIDTDRQWPLHNCFVKKRNDPALIDYTETRWSLI